MPDQEITSELPPLVKFLNKPDSLASSQSEKSTDAGPSPLLRYRFEVSDARYATPIPSYVSFNVMGR